MKTLLFGIIVGIILGGFCFNNWGNILSLSILTVYYITTYTMFARKS